MVQPTSLAWNSCRRGLMIRRLDDSAPAALHPLQVAAWHQHTTAHYHEVWLQGEGHSCIASPSQALCDAVCAALLGDQ